MAKSKPPVRLLFIGLSVETAEKIISMLRNAGYGTRPTHANNLEKAEEILANDPLDLIFHVADRNHEELQKLAEELSKTGKNTPIIALSKESNVENFKKVLSLGAAAATTIQETELILHATQAQLKFLFNKRRLRKAEQSLRESEKRCYGLLDSSKDAIAYVHEGMHVYANQAYLDLYKYQDFSEIEGLPILDLVASSDSGGLKDILKKLSKGESPPEKVELKGKKNDGELVDVVMTFSPASIDDEPCTQINVYDRSLDPALAQELKELKTHDLVTGLANRQFFIDELDNASTSAMEGKGGGSLTFIKLDNFTKILEKIGISHLDPFIANLAELLKQQIRSNDVAARFSDHEFTVLSKGTDADQGEAFAEKLKKAFETHIAEVGKQSINVTVSIGIVAIGESASSAHELINHAANAAAKAIAQGGNQVIRYNPLKEARELSEKSQHWKHMIKNALRTDGFKLMYQPMVSMHGDSGIYYKVFLRMIGPGNEEISPKLFLKAAQEENLTTQIDRWVIKKALEVIQDKPSDVEQFRLFVRITEESIEDETLMPWLAKQLKEKNLAGNNLVLEVPENIVATRIKQANSFVQALKKQNGKFSITEFGAGLNSTQLLQHIDSDYVKFDQTITNDLANNQENADKLKELNEECKKLNKPTIVEFVESATNMSVLWQLGVDFAQGNFLQEIVHEPSYESD